jgi:hypothetical protein
LKGKIVRFKLVHRNPKRNEVSKRASDEAITIQRKA